MFPPEEITSLIDKRPEFWHDAGSTARRVTAGFPEKMKTTASLYLIKPDKILSVSVWSERNTYPGAEKPTKRRRVFAIKHQEHLHDFEIEDPKFADKYYPKFPSVDESAKVIKLAKPGETLLCVSLAGLWYGYHYKIAAGIFEPLLDEDESE